MFNLTKCGYSMITWLMALADRKLAILCRKNLYRVAESAKGCIQSCIPLCEFQSFIAIDSKVFQTSLL